MKVLTKEEEQAHYNATVKGGVLGGVAGLAAGALGVVGASRRFPAFRALTLPFRAFLVTSSASFAAVIAADRASAKYDLEHNEAKRQEVEREQEREYELTAGKTTLERAKGWASENRYPLVFGFWILSLGGSFALVHRQPLSASQKLVQARMYAQGSTLAVLLASFAMEGTDAAKGQGRWETVKVLDPNDPTHKHYIERKIHHERYSGEDQWREMVEAEEQRIKARQEAAKGKQEEAKKHEKKASDKEQKAETKSTA